MKKIFFPVALLLVLCFTKTYSQVQFGNLSLKEALQKAKASDKMVMLQIESDECTECNTVAMQGFANPVLGNAVNASCVSIKVKAGTKEFQEIDSVYHIATTLGIVFLNSDGSFLLKYPASTSRYATYMEQLTKALDKKQHPDTEYAQMLIDYQNGKRDFDLLYKLVAKKNELQLDHDQLTDEMISAAPKDSAGSPYFLAFVTRQSPVINSKADTYIHANQRIFIDGWYLMPAQERSMINGRINAKSKEKAIKEKNIAYAQQIASRTAQTYSERSAAIKSYDKNMLDYYKGVKDTTTYLHASVKYYDQYLMTISVDSIRKADSVNKQEQLTKIPPNVLKEPGANQMMTKTIQFAPVAQFYTSQLNEAAWALYTYTHDPAYTDKALAWAKRATEFYDNPAAMDTYAKLLYRTGNKEEAIAWEEKAIKVLSDRRMVSAGYDDTSKKMKAGISPLDKY